MYANIYLYTTVLNAIDNICDMEFTNCFAYRAEALFLNFTRTKFIHVCSALLGHCDAKLLMTRLFGFVTASEMLS